MRYFIELAYQGTNYNGWQIQPNAATVQETLEKACAVYFKEEVKVTGAGRTDTGVHASYYVAHFDIDDNNELDAYGFVKSLNAILPDDIAIYSLVPVKNDTHARFNAVSRTYKYFILGRKDPFKKPFAHRIFKPINLDLMNECARELLKVNDFSSFCKLHSHTNTNLCKVFMVNWNYNENEYVFTIKADRFLRNMVRAIVGTLLDVGNNKLTKEQFITVINQKNRSIAGSSAPSQGLFLVDIEYPVDLFQRKVVSPHHPVI